MSPPSGHCHDHDLCDEKHRSLRSEVLAALAQVNATLTRVEAQTSATNGRVRALERFKLIIATAVCVLGAMYGVPEAIGKVTSFLITSGAVAINP